MVSGVKTYRRTIKSSHERIKRGRKRGKRETYKRKEETKGKLMTFFYSLQSWICWNLLLPHSTPTMNAKYSYVCAKELKKQKLIPFNLSLSASHRSETMWMKWRAKCKWKITSTPSIFSREYLLAYQFEWKAFCPHLNIFFLLTLSIKHQHTKKAVASWENKHVKFPHPPLLPYQLVPHRRYSAAVRRAAAQCMTMCISDKKSSTVADLCELTLWKMPELLQKQSVFAVAWEYKVSLVYVVRICQTQNSELPRATTRLEEFSVG